MLNLSLTVREPLRPVLSIIKLFTIQVLENIDFPQNGEISPKLEESGKS